MCYVCDGWNDRNGQGAGADGTTPASLGSGGEPISPPVAPYVFDVAHWKNAQAGP